MRLLLAHTYTGLSTLYPPLNELDKYAQEVQRAADGTRKLVSVLTSGEGAGKKVETVIIPMLR